jgi:hypothetical protein
MLMLEPPTTVEPWFTTMLGPEIPGRTSEKSGSGMSGGMRGSGTATWEIWELALIWEER